MTIDSAKSVIQCHDSPDLPFDYSLNAYRGCEHGCIYCYVRPSHGCLNLSPGLDFETKLFATPEAAKLLRAELAKPSCKCSLIAPCTGLAHPAWSDAAQAMAGFQEGTASHSDA